MIAPETREAIVKNLLTTVEAASPAFVELEERK